jgi:anthranilate phosphoribosyltransferase
MAFIRVNCITTDDDKDMESDMNIMDAIKKVVDGYDLAREEAEAVLEQIMDCQCTDAQIASLLTGLRIKGETVNELIGFATVMRKRATAVVPLSARASVAKDESSNVLVDTCGTGGDVKGSFNISTATAFVIAGAGVRVAKHGNRSVSSRCGSSDVIEALGVKIDLPPERIRQCIDVVGIGYLHAPLLHDGMKYVASVRKQMGIRTIFNLLGPLTNPAGTNIQVVGVYAAQLTELLAQALAELGSKRVLVVHGSDGLDEITITGESLITEMNKREVTTYTIGPEDFGLKRASMKDIQGGSARHNAEIIFDVLRGQTGPRRDIVLLNAAAALIASSRVNDFLDGIRLAAESIDSGNALAKLQDLICFTSAFAAPGEPHSHPTIQRASLYG